MKITNEQIFNLYDTLNEIISNKDNILPVRTGFNFIKNFRVIAEARTAIDEARQRIIRVGCENPQNPTPREIENINIKLIELGAIEDDLPLILIPLDEILELKLSLYEMNVLMPILKSEE